jgi:GT2 family glycosyltransferase
LRARRPGKSRQLNAGIARAAGRLLLLTDDDVRLDPAWRDAMVACFADPEVGMVCGRVDGLHYGPATPAGGAEGEPFDAPFETWTYAHGALMAVRATAAWHAGGFDERLGPGAPAHGEEHDLLLRLRRRGWTVRIVPAAPAQHVEWRDAAARRRNALVYERGAGAFVGAALRRSGHDGLAVLSRRLAHQGWLLTVDWKLGIRALPAFAGGLAYGLRLRERPWLRPGGGREGQ